MNLADAVMCVAEYYGWSFRDIMGMPWSAFCAALDYRADTIKAEGEAAKKMQAKAARGG